MKKIIAIMLLSVVLLTGCFNASGATKVVEDTKREETIEQAEEIVEQAQEENPENFVAITEDNYQDIHIVAAEYGLSLTAKSYMKAPAGMFEGEEVQFVDAFIPLSSNFEHINDGYAVQSGAHGIQVYQTIRTGETAEAVVNEMYQVLVQNPDYTIIGDEESTTYLAEMDIALKFVYGVDALTNEPIVKVLYADTRGNNFYLFADISYYLAQTDELYESMLAETSFVFGIELPVIPAYEE